MIDFKYLQTELSATRHLILSADQELYKILEEGEHHSFDDYIDPLYRDSFSKNVAKADGTWFPARLLLKSGSVLFYIQAKKVKKTDSIRLYLVSIDNLLIDRESLLEIVSTMNAQMALYDDIFFDYDPESLNLSLYNTQAADFDAGVYSVEETESILCRKVSPDMQDSVKTFIRQIKSKPGRFSTTIEGNLINNDPNITSTLLEASYALMPSGKEKVIGHIHPISKHEGSKASILKRDFLTGLVDKADITRIAQERIDQKKLEGTTLAIIDLDYFKSINDTFGHQFGDTVLKKVAEIISSEVGNYGIAGRFGGDEFLLIFYKIPDEEHLRLHLKNIHKAVKAAFDDSPISKDSPMSLSIGTATYSKDADNYQDVFMLADYCLYIAKEKGRNRYIIYTPEKHGSLEEIKQKSMTQKKINERGDLSYGDVIVKMYDIVLYGRGSTPEVLMEEFAHNFNLQRVMLLTSDPYKLRYSAGVDRGIDNPVPSKLLEVLNSDIKERVLAGRDFVVVNKIDNLPPQADEIKDFLKKIGVLSYLLIRFYDKDNRECILVFSSIGKYTQWNETHFKYYRAFVALLARFSLDK